MLTGYPLQQVSPRAYSRLSSDMSVRVLLAWANSLKLATVNSILADERQTFRRDNPQVEAYGEMFYDWQPVLAQTGTQLGGYSQDGMEV
jgi:hypothetical protein